MQIGPRIRFDRHTGFNLLKNLSPVAGTIIGGPLGLAAAGGLSTLGDLGRGKNIGQAVKGGVQNAALTAAGQGVAGHFGYHGGLSGWGGPVASTPEVHTGALPGPGLAAHGSIPSISGGGLSDLTVPSTPGNLTGRALGAGGRLLDFAESHPTASAMGLNAVGSLATSGAQNREATASARLLEKQADESEYDFQRRKQRDESFAPLWGSLGTAIGQGYSKVAPNPYAVGGG